MSKEERNHPASRYGSDKQFLKWVTYQPSALDGEFNQHEDNEGKPRNIACHVRRLKLGAGMGIKPPFSAIAMTDDQHKLQSSKDGEVKVLRKYLGLVYNADEAAKWFEDAANDALNKWIEHRRLTQVIEF